MEISQTKMANDIIDEELVKIKNDLTSAEEKSEIQDFFDGTSVFLTGATGFLGRLILEKLLRACTGIDKIFILVRQKKGKSVQQRYKELFDIRLYDGLRRKDSHFFNKVILVEGDCVLPNLGISEQNQQILLNEVNCVFHCAATVRFDEKIRRATNINVRATRDILLLARNMKHLKSFVHISTAYSFCVHREIKEEFYETSITGDKLLNVVEALNDDILESIEPKLIGKWPNSYTFSKSVGEEVVKTYGKGLPIAIVRPSIVIATAKEPVAGWIDNILGATGVFVGAGLGVLRTLYCNKDCLAEMVPADFVINCSISAAWYAGKSHLDMGKKEVEPIIYNYIVSNQKPITWERTMDTLHQSAVQMPSPMQVWHYFFKLNSNYWVHYLYLVFFHRLPAYIIDFLAKCVGRKAMMVKGYKKIEKFQGLISYFSMKEWKFCNDNTQELWKKLNKKDKKLFDFNLDTFEWDPYFMSYTIGMRIYLLKDPLETIPQGIIKHRKLMVAHYTIITVVLIGFMVLLKFLWNAIF